MDLPLNLAGLVDCPDCDSDVGDLAEVTPGVFSVVVRHDETCPQYRSMSGGR